MTHREWLTTVMLAFAAARMHDKGDVSGSYCVLGVVVVLLLTGLRPAPEEGR